MEIQLTITISEEVMEEAKENGDSSEQLLSYYENIINVALDDDGGGAKITFIREI